MYGCLLPEGGGGGDGEEGGGGGGGGEPLLRVPRVLLGSLKSVIKYYLDILFLKAT